MEALTARQQFILNLLVEAHIASAQPVGSRYLTERFQVPYSAATVRHEMGMLEEMGYLTHPHTSSGRVPTDTGYRYYVDHGLVQTKPNQQDSSDFECWQQEIRQEVQSGDLEACAEEALRILTALSEEVGLVVLGEGLSEREEALRPVKLLIRGTTHLIEKPEFQDRHKIRNLFEAFEEKREISQWVTHETAEQGISVRIGRENEPAVLWECSIISAGYGSQKRHAGVIGVVGPRRMNYGRGIAAVAGMARLLEQIIQWPQEETE
jgi:heat-inducible transcriptional repressor